MEPLYIFVVGFALLLIFLNFTLNKHSYSTAAHDLRVEEAQRMRDESYASYEANRVVADDHRSNSESRGTTRSGLGHGLATYVLPDTVTDNEADITLTYLVDEPTADPEEYPIDLLRRRDDEQSFTVIQSVVDLNTDQDESYTFVVDDVEAGDTYKSTIKARSTETGLFSGTAETYEREPFLNYWNVIMGKSDKQLSGTAKHSGNGIKPVNSYAECATRCEDTSDCNGFTYFPKTSNCKLFDVGTTPLDADQLQWSPGVQHGNAISGVHSPYLENIAGVDGCVLGLDCHETVDCSFTNWVRGTCTPVSGTCGPATETQTRTHTTARGNGRTDPGECTNAGGHTGISKTISCTGTPCPVDCRLEGRWTYSPTSGQIEGDITKLCGAPHTQTKTKGVAVAELHGGSCPAENHADRYGTQEYTKVCVVEGASCTNDANCGPTLECDASTKKCIKTVDCVVPAWSTIGWTPTNAQIEQDDTKQCTEGVTWGGQSQTPGIGRYEKIKTRTATTPSTPGGTACSSDQLIKTTDYLKKCKKKADEECYNDANCPSSKECVERTKGTSTTKHCLFPADCRYTEWDTVLPDDDIEDSNDYECGVAHSQTFTREIIAEAIGSGTACGSLTESRQYTKNCAGEGESCTNDANCASGQVCWTDGICRTPVDCSYSDWSLYSPTDSDLDATALCGENHPQTRTRTKIDAQFGGDNTCADEEDTIETYNRSCVSFTQVTDAPQFYTSNQKIAETRATDEDECKQYADLMGDASIGYVWYPIGTAGGGSKCVWMKPFDPDRVMGGGSLQGPPAWLKSGSPITGPNARTRISAFKNSADIPPSTDCTSTEWVWNPTREQIDAGECSPSPITQTGTREITTPQWGRGTECSELGPDGPITEKTATTEKPCSSIGDWCAIDDDCGDGAYCLVAEHTNRCAEITNCAGIWRLIPGEGCRTYWGGRRYRRYEFDVTTPASPGGVACGASSGEERLLPCITMPSWR